MANVLREHLFHLLESATEDQLFAAVKVFEAPRSPGGVSTQAGDDLSISMDVDVEEADERRLFTPILSPQQQTASISEDDDAEELPDLPESPIVVRSQSRSLAAGTRRIAVSAAPMINVSDVSSFTPPVIEKTKEEEDQIGEGVASCPLFTKMESDDVNVIVAAMAKEEYHAGTNVLTEGQAGKAKFYMIASGTLDVIKQGKHVATLTQGMTFGELEIMYNRSECEATIRAVTESILFALDQQTYQGLVLKISIHQRELFMKLLNKVTFLETMSEYDRATLADLLVPATYQEGDHIVKFGEPGQWMHIISEGEVQVVGREKGKRVNVIRLGEGSPIGELEFLFNHSTVADVVAVSKRVKTAKLNRKHYEMAMGPISDELKNHVAKGEYQFYLQNTADEDVHKQIRNAERKKIKKSANNELKNLTEAGEVVVPIDCSNDSTEFIRFPLKTLASTSTVVIAIREDAAILHWNQAVAAITQYPKDEAVGVSLYSFLSKSADQAVMHTAIAKALKIVGDVEACEELAPDVYTLVRGDGLTKVQLRLSVIPAVVPRAGGKAEVLLVVGNEVKKKPTSIQQEKTQEVALHVKEVLEGVGERIKDNKDAAEGIDEALAALSKLSAVSSTDLESKMESVNVRHMMGMVASKFAVNVLEKNINLKTSSADDVPQEVYLDSAAVPEIIKFCTGKAVEYGSTVVTIHCECISELGMNMLRWVIADDGPGVNVTKVLAQNSYQKITAAVRHLGGEYSLKSTRKETKSVFTVPLLKAESQEQTDETEANTKTYSTLLVEESPLNKNMLCSHLWQRKHAVLPATNWAEMLRMIDNSDILIINPECTIDFAGGNPMQELRKRTRNMAIIVTSESFEADVEKAYQQAGMFTLRLPCSATQATSVLQRAEDRVAELRVEKERIDQVRETFNKTNRGEWKKGKLLGKGAFGEVFEAIDVLTGGKMAVKCLRVTPDVNVDELLNEIEVMCTLQHENIIHYFYCEKSEANVVNVLMEMATGGTLQQKCQIDQPKLTVPEIASYTRQIVEAVAYIHSKNIVHCDLKTANVLLSGGGSDQKCKIGDFGTAKQLKEGEKTYIMQGTPIYMAPECMNADIEENIGFDISADIWSIGCIVFELALQKPPFYHIQGGGMGLLRYISELTDNPDLHPLFEEPPAIFEFVRACLEVDPTKRPTAKQLLDFSLFQQDSGDWDSAFTALEKARFWHQLCAFVAFQEPEDDDGPSAIKSILENKPRRESLFFDSSDDEEEEEDIALLSNASSAMLTEPAGSVGPPPATDFPSPPSAGGYPQETSPPTVTGKTDAAKQPILTPTPPENPPPVNPRPHQPTAHDDASSNDSHPSMAAVLNIHNALQRFVGAMNAKHQKKDSAQKNSTESGDGETPQPAVNVLSMLETDAALLDQLTHQMSQGSTGTSNDAP